MEGLHLKLKNVQKSEIKSNNSLMINKPIKTNNVSIIHSFLLQMFCKFNEWIHLNVINNERNRDKIEHVGDINFSNINKLRTKFMCEKHKCETRI